jgi:hypothetical protein
VRASAGDLTRMPVRVARCMGTRVKWGRGVLCIERPIAHNDIHTHRRLFIQTGFSGYGFSFHKELGEK